MKKNILTLVILLFSILLIGCNNEIRESQKTEEIIEVSKQEKQSEKNIIESEEESLPSFTDIDAPSITLLSSNGEKKFPTFDHSYGEICWNNCDEFKQYNYPSIHSGKVEIGDQLQVDWSSLKPLPTEIHLIQIDYSDEYNLKELVKEQKDPENTMFKVAIDEEMIGNQYALEFIWKDETSTSGKSIMNFKLEK
ncbi:hypothetical protein [Planococcus sp. ISL-110]|uniref:hypothetical protein n=1 Tax=Planococcus sp. ISL-110 TaxID=2819167 RepID=UPI001BE91F3E|nr:hypothetical protein [Planococcus sp. ISL-110]MBT2571614.1 hypothetical protein [Planococcus sp. ISL-110]